MRIERRLAPDTDLFAYLRGLEPEERRQATFMLGMEEGDALDRAWPDWAHEGQAPPPDDADGSDWRTWVLMAGRGFGKTLAGAKWITEAIAASASPSRSREGAGGGPLRIALIGATLDDARRVMVEGRSGLLEVASGWIREWSPTLRRLKFRTGAEAVLFSGCSPDQLRGPEHHLAWCDELAKWEKPRETWDMLQFGLRLGGNPRALITTTPRSGPVLTEILAEPGTILTRGRTAKNPHNSPAWRESIHARYAGTRLGRQELDGEILPEAGALWSVELIERCRAAPFPGESRGPGRGEASDSSRALRAWTPASAGEQFVRLVIAVDPPSGGGTCGIIACAKDAAGIAHVLADHSVAGASPERWAKAVADAVAVWTAIQSTPFSCESRSPAQEKDWAPAFAGAHSVPVEVVAEQNQGGSMVKAILRTADPGLRVKPVTATVSKSERAAPVAHLFEAGKVLLHGRFPELEAELLGIVLGEDYKGPGNSPDRADAMVWGLTELMLGVQREPSIRRL